MKILGFAFTKIHADRKVQFDQNCNKNINIDFLDITRETIEILKTDAVYNINFKYNVTYLEPNTKKEINQAEVLLEGVLTIGLDKTEDKDLSKTYKKKEMSDQLKEIVFNFLLRKCSPKAIDLEDQLALPSHIPMPQVRFNKETKDNKDGKDKKN